MLHPILEWREDPLSAGMTYGSTAESGAVLSILPHGFVGLPILQLAAAAVLAVSGIAIALTGIYKYMRGEE